MAAGLYLPDPRAPASAGEPDIYAGIPAVQPAGDPLALMRSLGAGMVTSPTYAPDMPAPGPDIFTNADTGDFYVNGMQFAQDDAQAALDSEKLLGQPGKGQPPPGNWMALDQGAYSSFLDSIKNPSLKRLAKKNFGIGVDQGQMLLGRGLQLAGAEKFGGNMVAQQQEDLRKTLPFNRQFTDINSPDTAVQWLVANFAQQGPNLIESIATALAGAAVGTAAGGPAAGAGAALAGLAGKAAWKKAVLTALEKKAAGGVLEPVEAKLLREAAAMAGAAAATTANNVGIGASDVYGELRDAGAGPDDTQARMSALWRSAPYAALESLPEFALAFRWLNPGNLTRPLAGMSLPGKGVELLRRGVVGGAVGGTLEGLTEAGQEGLLIGANDKAHADSPEGINRLVNSFAAGFGMGGPIGAMANLRGGHPTDLANPNSTRDPVAPTPTTPPTAPTEGPPLGPPVEPLTLQREMPLESPSGIASPWSPSQPVMGPEAPMQVAPGQQALPFEQSGDQMGLFDLIPPPQQPTNPRFRGSVPTQENMSPGVVPGSVNELQGAFQFAPPPPAGPHFTAPVPQTAIAQQLMQAQQQQADDAAYAQRAAEQQAQQEQLRNQAFAQAEGQRQLDMIPPTPAPIDTTLANMPMREQAPAAPQQQQLFKRGETPRPSATERLRRGIQSPTKATPTTEEQIAERDALLAERATLERALEVKGVPAFTRNKVAARARIKAITQRLTQLPPVSPAGTGQLGLFTSTGAPSMAALKGAGKRQLTKAIPAGTGIPQIPPTRSAANPVTVAAARAKAAEKQGPKRGLKKQAGVAAVEKANAVQERSPATVDVREQAGTRKGMGGEVPTPSEAARAIAQLRKAKTQAQAEPDQREKIVPPVKEPPKETPPVPKTEAAAAVSAAAAAPAQSEAKAATSAEAKAAGPVAITVKLADGTVLQNKDGQRLLDAVDRSIEKYERFLACLRGK